jgi:hypothetical protein
MFKAYNLFFQTVKQIKKPLKYKLNKNKIKSHKQKW